MKTETEKAIEFCENVMYQEDVCDCEEDDLLYNEEMRKVIALLQQGEKYKKLISHLKDLYDAEMPTTKVLTPYTKKNIPKHYKMIEYLEQKYFPKELPDEKTTKL